MEKQELTFADKVAVVNSWLNSGLTTLPLVFGLFNLVKDMFRRKEAGEPQPTFDETVDVIYNGGTTLITKADAWLEANGYNADGSKKA